MQKLDDLPFMRDSEKLQRDADRLKLRALLGTMYDNIESDNSDASPIFASLKKDHPRSQSTFLDTVADYILEGNSELSRADNAGLDRYMRDKVGILAQSLKAIPAFAEALDTSKEELDRININQQEQNIAEMKNLVNEQKKQSDAAMAVAKQTAEETRDAIEQLKDKNNIISQFVSEYTGRDEGSQRAEEMQNKEPVTPEAAQIAQQTIPDVAQATPMPDTTTPPPPPSQDMSMQTPTEQPPIEPTPAEQPPMEQPAEQPPAPPAGPEMFNPSQGMLDAVQSPYGA